MDTLAEEIWQMCRTELCGLYPTLNGAFALLPQRPGDFLGTDGRVLYTTRELVGLYGENPARARRGYLHILLHCLFLHIRVPEGIAPEDWGLACDIWVEKYIRELREPRLEVDSGLLPALCQWAEETPWKILTTLPRLPWPRKAVEQAVCFDSHSAWNRQLPEEVAQKWKSAASGLDGRGGLRGSFGGNREETPEPLHRGKTELSRLLERYVVPGEELEVDEDSIDYLPYSLGIALYGNMPLIEPLEYREVWRVDTLAIAIDTSASCNRALVSRFLAEAYGILSAREHFFRKMQVAFFQCDCCLQDWRIVRSREEWLSYCNGLTIKGRGGTDYTPVFRQIERLVEQGDIRMPRALLYFTDGDGVYPEKPAYETVFLLAGEGQRRDLVPAWARSVILE